MGQSLAVAGQRITPALLNRMCGEADTTSRTVTAGSMSDFGSSYTIPANDAAVGTCYRYTVIGHGTQGSTAQQLNTQMLIGSTNFIGTDLTSGLVSPSAGFHFWYQAMLIIVSTGSAGTFNAGLLTTMSQAAATTASNSGTSAGHSDAVAIDTTVSQTIKMQLYWASTTGSPTITCDATIFERSTSQGRRRIMDGNGVTYGRAETVESGLPYQGDGLQYVLSQLRPGRAP